jgi:hypothetical protein
MFALEQPSMALNDTRAPKGVKVIMEITRTVTPDEGISSILGSVIAAAKATKEGKLKNLIFSCHGHPGELQMGCGITRDLTNRFSALVVDNKPLVETIYLRACQVARIDAPGSATDGNLFCCEIAKNARCKVVASTADQVRGLNELTFGQLDRFEGTALVYGPDGNVLSSYTNPLYDPWKSPINNPFSSDAQQ